MVDERALHRLTGDTVELLRALVANACVNDGTPDSGHEVDNAEAITSLLEAAGAEVEVFEPHPGRRSVVARLEGTDPAARATGWLGHTDVVPADPATWARDPFGAELVDGEVWGRGTVDMLGLTASMAVAFAHLVAQGHRPPGDLVYLAVADEEAGSRYGARWLAEHAWDRVAVDDVLTELGGAQVAGPRGRALLYPVGEKGVAWRRLVVHGTPGHGSMPFGADNAVVTAAEVVRRLAGYAAEPRLDRRWQGFVSSLDLDDATVGALTDPARIGEALAGLDPDVARELHGCSHPTISPNLVRGGSKTNVIADRVELDVDIRTLPGETTADVAEHLATALGDLADRVEIEDLLDDPATVSPTDTPLWHALGEAVRGRVPDGLLVPRLSTYFTDARVFRQRGAVAYGAGLFSDTVSPFELARRFHGVDERIDVGSLQHCTALWLALATHLE